MEKEDFSISCHFGSCEEDVCVYSLGCIGWSKVRGGRIFEKSWLLQALKSSLLYRRRFQIVRCTMKRRNCSKLS